MTTLFRTVLDGMINNNEINDAQFSSWDDADHAIEVYSDNFNGECDQVEIELTISALNTIIDSNGVLMDDAVDTFNSAVWG